jgi:hypothetical protein
MIVTPVTTVASDGINVGLVPGRTYEVLGIEGDYYRVLTDSDHPHCPNDPVLCQPAVFRVVDAAEPEFWITEFVEGARYSYPAEWIKGYFFEDYHDRVQEVRDRFWSDLKRLYPTTWNVRVGTADTSLERTRER